MTKDVSANDSYPITHSDKSAVLVSRKLPECVSYYHFIMTDSLYYTKRRQTVQWTRHTISQRNVSLSDIKCLVVRRHSSLPWSLLVYYINLSWQQKLRTKPRTLIFYLFCDLLPGIKFSKRMKCPERMIRRCLQVEKVGGACIWWAAIVFPGISGISQHLFGWPGRLTSTQVQIKLMTITHPALIENVNLPPCCEKAAHAHEVMCV